MRLLYIPALTCVLGLAGCAGTPRVETAVSGALPVGRGYALVEAGKYYGAAGRPVDALEACLSRGGMRAAGRADDTLVQVAATLRPARSRLIVGEDAGGAARRSTSRLREELVVAISDAGSGALLLRASAARILPRGAKAGTSGAALAQALCAAILAPGEPGARSR